MSRIGSILGQFKEDDNQNVILTTGGSVTIPPLNNQNVNSEHPLSPNEMAMQGSALRTQTQTNPHEDGVIGAVTQDGPVESNLTQSKLQENARKLHEANPNMSFADLYQKSIEKPEWDKKYQKRLDAQRKFANVVDIASTLTNLGTAFAGGNVVPTESTLKQVDTKQKALYDAYQERKKEYNMGTYHALLNDLQRKNSLEDRDVSLDAANTRYYRERADKRADMLVGAELKDASAKDLADIKSKSDKELKALEHEYKLAEERVKDGSPKAKAELALIGAKIKNLDSSTAKNRTTNTYKNNKDGSITYLDVNGKPRKAYAKDLNGDAYSSAVYQAMTADGVVDGTDYDDPKAMYQAVKTLSGKSPAAMKLIRDINVARKGSTSPSQPQQSAAPAQKKVQNKKSIGW